MHLARKTSLKIAVLLVILTQAACQQQSPDTGSLQLSMTDFRFTGDNLNTTTGVEVTWVNNGEASHTVTAEDGTFDSGNIPPGGSFTFVFTEPGTYHYVCQYHSGAGMVATLNVR